MPGANRTDQGPLTSWAWGISVALNCRRVPVAELHFILARLEGFQRQLAGAGGVQLGDQLLFRSERAELDHLRVGAVRGHVFAIDAVFHFQRLDDHDRRIVPVRHA